MYYVAYVYVQKNKTTNGKKCNLILHLLLVSYDNFLLILLFSFFSFYLVLQWRIILLYVLSGRRICRLGFISFILIFYSNRTKTKKMGILNGLVCGSKYNLVCVCVCLLESMYNCLELYMGANFALNFEHLH